MELRQLKYFVTLAEDLHFGRAADRVGIAQPALSQQIRQLEQELGGALFIRTKRSVSLTAAGSLFYEEARNLLHHADRAVDKVSRAFSGMIGEIRIGFVESATWDILPQVISAYRQKYPEVQITPCHLHSSSQIEALLDGTLSIGITGIPVNEPLLMSYSIRSEPFWVAFPPEHPLGNRHTVHIGELSRESFITTNREVGKVYYDTMIQVCMEAGFSPAIVQTADEMHTLLSLVSSGLGIALIHESARHLRTDLAYKPVLGVSQSAYRMSFVWKKDPISPLLRGFLDTMQKLYPQQDH
ncbi:LysR family transcriptional regulator [Paenibacillus cineris]|uniref:LysR family transcriptional regulator n=1 Tax=Paenibacillus cineris TaxID=237530 RepID=UPI001B0BB92A|nr:LysR family transcriptional regulator [Paenibacillus cineris]GIO60466.1 LysR family transcriptional regulator [Paenibacillus cineris]